MLAPVLDPFPSNKIVVLAQSQLSDAVATATGAVASPNTEISAVAAHKLELSVTVNVYTPLRSTTGLAVSAPETIFPFTVVH